MSGSGFSVADFPEWFGYSAQLWFVDKDEGGYGIIFLTNTESDFNAEARSLWIFGSLNKTPVLLFEETSQLYADTLVE